MLGVGRSGPLGPAALSPAASGGAAGIAGSPWAPPTEAERFAVAVLVSVPGVGPATLARLIADVGSASGVLRMATRAGGGAHLSRAAAPANGRTGGITGDIADAIVVAARGADEIVRQVQRAGLSVITLDDEAYPSRLRSIEMPPLALFVRGPVPALAPRRAVAVVGTRAATLEGRQLAAHLAATLSTAGATVVSGLAVGIDGAAHEGVVAVHGPTVAVLGGGHDRLYPAMHERLAERIVEHGGAVVSEHAPRTSPTRWTFPNRNRVIAGLSEATVVVEAGRRSGALTTAMWSLEQGRGCFVVPGALGAPTWAGCLELLRACHGQARIVAGVAELLADLDLPDEVAVGDESPSDGDARSSEEGRRAGVPGVAAVLVELGPTARSVGRALVAGHASPDDLVAATDLPIATVLAALTVLEGRGLAVSAYGRYRAAGSLAAASPMGRRPRRRSAPQDA